MKSKLCHPVLCLTAMSLLAGCTFKLSDRVKGSGVVATESRAEKTPPAKARTTVQPPATPAKTRPAWVDAPPHVVGGAYQTSITVGPYTTRGECDARLPEAVQESVDRYVETWLEADTTDPVRLPGDYLRQQLVKDQWEETRQYSVGPMIQLHALLRFDRQVKDRILEERRRTVVAGRLWLTGSAVLAALALLAALYGYLKWSGGSPETSPG